MNRTWVTSIGMATTRVKADLHPYHLRFVNPTKFYTTLNAWNEEDGRQKSVYNLAIVNRATQRPRLSGCSFSTTLPKKLWQNKNSHPAKALMEDFFYRFYSRPRSHKWSQMANKIGKHVFNGNNALKTLLHEFFDTRPAKFWWSINYLTNSIRSWGVTANINKLICF